MTCSGAWGEQGDTGHREAVEFDLLPIPEFYCGALYFDGSDAATVLHEWRRWCASLPERVATSIALMQLPEMPDVPPPLAGRFTVAVRYVALGDFDEAARLLEPMRAVAEPLIDAIRVLPYAAIGAVHADPPNPMPVYEDQALLRELPVEAVDALLAVAGPDADSVQVIVELRQLGGAFVHADHHRCRGARDPVSGHAGAVMDAVRPWSAGGQLPNFAPASDLARLARCLRPPTGGPACWPGGALPRSEHRRRERAFLYSDTP